KKDRGRERSEAMSGDGEASRAERGGVGARAGNRREVAARVADESRAWELEVAVSRTAESATERADARLTRRRTPRLVLRWCRPGLRRRRAHETEGRGG